MMKILLCAAVMIVLGRPAAAQKAPGEAPHTRLENPAADMPSEAEIVGFLDEVNQGEVDAARMALERSKNPEVIEFANQMVTVHGENRRMTDEIGIQAARGETTNKLKAKHKMLSVRLGKLEGPAFDRAYMAAMVDGHESALDKLDRKMIPAAKTGALVRHLQETRPAVEEHLEQARRIKTGLGSK